MTGTSELIAIGDTHLFVRRIGVGEPVFVIHGGPGLNHNYLLPHLDELSENYELIYFDQRYCGQSENNLELEKIIISQLVDDIERIRIALGYDMIILLGHSFGAHLAFRYAIAYPQHVRKIISVCGLSITWMGVGLFAKEFLKRTKHIRDKLEQIRQSRDYQEGNPSSHQAFYNLVFASYCHDPKSIEKLRLIFTKESAKNEAFVSFRLRNQLFIEKFDLSVDLNNLNIPILVIHGSSDPYPAERARVTTEQLKNGYYVELQECGHFPFVEKPKEFQDAVIKFLNQTSAG